MNTLTHTDRTWKLFAYGFSLWSSLTRPNNILTILNKGNSTKTVIQQNDKSIFRVHCLYNTNDGGTGRAPVPHKYKNLICKSVEGFYCFQFYLTV